MAALPENINLNPETVKEHLIVINQKIDTILESQAEDREILADYMQRTNDWIKCHDVNLLAREKQSATNTEKIADLEKRVNSWSLINSIGAAVAVVLAALGLRGS